MDKENLNTKEYHVAFKKVKVASFATIWMNLEDIKLQKENCYMVSLRWTLKKSVSSQRSRVWNHDDQRHGW